MKNKSYILLLLYDDLRAGKGIRIAECCGQFGFSVATFRRYIAFLRGYFNEIYGQEIVYDAETLSYRLAGVTG